MLDVDPTHHHYGTAKIKTLQFPPVSLLSTAAAKSEPETTTVTNSIKMNNSLTVLLFLSCLQVTLCFQNVQHIGVRLGSIPSHDIDDTSTSILRMANNNGSDENYQNKVAEFFSNFLPGDSTKSDQEDPLGEIDFSAPKMGKLSLEALAQALDEELYEKEWFVTGKVNPIYFSDRFKFQDPDVSIDGIEEYARGVCKLFDQETSRAEIVKTEVNGAAPNTITCTWRLSGRVQIGPGLPIKPYIVYTDFTVDPDTGLVIFQEDRFSIAGWDILVSALFPFLVGKVTAPPAEPVPPRQPKAAVTDDKKPSWWPM